MSEKKRRLKKRHSTILMIVFAVAVCYFLISFIVMQSDIKSQEKYNAQLRTQLADKKAENEELEKLVKSSDLDDYVEQIARRELGYVFPDERVYYNELGHVSHLSFPHIHADCFKEVAMFLYVESDAEIITCQTFTCHIVRIAQGIDQFCPVDRLKD